jgi:hypothetical protein
MKLPIIKSVENFLKISLEVEVMSQMKFMIGPIKKPHNLWQPIPHRVKPPLALSILLKV